MNIFIVHSGCDKDAVEKVKADLQEKESRAKVLVIGNGEKLWKRAAKSLIKQAQMVLFVVGERSHLSKNIDWELKRALKHNKFIMCYKLDKSYKVNKCLTGKDIFSNNKETLLAYEADSVDQIAEKVRKYENSEYDVFNGDINEMKRSELLEQYKIFLATSESLVSRRQTVNSFYLSANTALITIMGGLAAVFDNIGERAVLFVLTGVVGIVLSVSWSRILSAYGTLNGSKMKVISIIEKNLPASLYDAEWMVMSDKLNSKKYISFTDSEKRTPKAFVIFYIILIIAAIIVEISLWV